MAVFRIKGKTKQNNKKMAVYWVLLSWYSHGLTTVISEKLQLWLLDPPVEMMICSSCWA